MHPDIEAQRPKLKEILYDCAVEVRATKAALYLYDGASRFDLTSEYGFKVPIREWADRNDPIVDRCGRGRTPFIVNGLAAEPRFSEILYESQTERMLVVPLYLRGQLVGILDMRDKAGKQPFEATDIPKGQQIADRILSLFSDKNVFGQKYITLSQPDHEVNAVAAGVDISRPKTAETPMARPAAPPPPPPPAGPRPAPLAEVFGHAPASTAPPPPRPVAREPRTSAHVPRVAAMVLEARTASADLLTPRSDDVLGETEMLSIRESLKSTLSIPDAVVAMFSALAQTGGIQEVASRAAMTDEASLFLQSRLNIWLSKRGEAAGVTRVTQIGPLGPPGPPIEVSQLQKVFTAPVNAGTLRGMYLTVGFSGAPDRNAHELLAENLNQLQIALEYSLNRAALQRTRIAVAEKILEPDFSRFPALRHHTDFVVELVDLFARDLALPQADADQLHLLAIVHDAGMRLLEYEQLYRKRGLSDEEVEMLREHVFVGAALAAPLLGGEIARAVLCHHERVDGRGYPYALRGEQIPYASRVLQICDAFAAMTDVQGYQPPESPDAALGIITRGAGAQFDPDLAAHFVDMMRRRG